MKTPKKQERGALGNTVASHNRFGDYLRNRVIPKYRTTPARRLAWGSLTALSDLWNEITEEQRDGWHALGEHVPSRSRCGQSAHLDGRLLFLKLNRVLTTCSHPPLRDAPPLPAFGSNPITGFSINYAKHRLHLKLAVPKASAEEIMCFASPPCPPGKRVTTDFGFLGVLSPPTAGHWDIAELYLAKLKEWRKLKDKKYHRPLRGAKVFVRAWQQVNGWENKTWMFVARGFVPITAPAAAEE